MKRFKLKEATVTVRGDMILVREITHAERLQWVKTSQEDHFRGPALLVSLGALDPKVTEDEVGEMPADVVQALTDKIMELSGLSKAKQQPDAGGAVPVPSESSVRAVAK